MSDRGRSSAQLSGVLRTKAHMRVVTLRAHVNDLPQIEPHRPVLGPELVPAGAAEGLVQRLQLLVADAQRQHLAALEADADPACAAGHQCASKPAAGSTISVSTPAVARGCRNATREPRMPTRGHSSISAMPDSFNVASVASISPTW